MNDKNEILSPYRLNQQFNLKNRIIMAPMTRTKANDALEATDEMAQYYARRAEAGLIITEGTIIRPDGLGYYNVPGVYTDSQINHWKKVTTEVHQNNGLIFLQIWHVGRVSHPMFLNGNLPIAPSETTMTGKVRRSHNLIHGGSRAVSLNEIKELINDYVIAAKNAIKAGFDGVEIHGANGYLIDQFLHYHTNLRTDEYGGSFENLARFALDILNACGQAIGYERVGIRLSPGGYLNEIIGEPRDAQVFKYLLEQLNKLHIAYVHTGNFDDSKKFPELNNMSMTEFMRKYYQGILIASGGYSFDHAVDGINNNLFDLVAFGRPFIANPDLIQRFAKNQNLNQYDVSMLKTLY